MADVVSPFRAIHIETMQRPEGRAASSLRPLSCELACLVNADGSALIRSGATHVLACVHVLAPRQMHDEGPYAKLSVIIKSGTLTGSYEHEWETIVTDVLMTTICLDKYPRSIIQVVVQIVSADGSVLSTIIQASIAALMDAGLELNILPTATTCLVSSDSELKLDPTAEEERGAGIVVLVMNPSDDEILAIHTSNIQLNVEQLLECTVLAGRASGAITSFWRLCIEQKATRESQTLWAT